MALRTTSQPPPHDTWATFCCLRMSKSCACTCRQEPQEPRTSGKELACRLLLKAPQAARAPARKGGGGGKGRSTGWRRWGDGAREAATGGWHHACDKTCPSRLAPTVARALLANGPPFKGKCSFKKAKRFSPRGPSSSSWRAQSAWCTTRGSSRESSTAGTCKNHASAHTRGERRTLPAFAEGLRGVHGGLSDSRVSRPTC